MQNDTSHFGYATFLTYCVVGLRVQLDTYVNNNIQMINITKQLNNISN